MRPRATTKGDASTIDADATIALLRIEALRMLREYRSTHDLTRRELADALGVNCPMLRWYLDGRRALGFAHVVRIFWLCGFELRAMPRQDAWSKP